jgi:hypothetical protein
MLVIRNYTKLLSSVMDPNYGWISDNHYSWDIGESIIDYLDTNLIKMSQIKNKLKDLSILLGRLFVTLNRNCLSGFLD